MNYLDEFKKIKVVDIPHEETYAFVRDVIEEYITFSQVGDAKDARFMFWPLYQQARNKIPSQLRNQYEEVLTKWRVFTFLSLDDSEIEELFRHNVLSAFRLATPIFEEVKEYIDVFHDYYKDFENANKMLSFLKENDEVLQEKTVREWLGMYQIFAGSVESRDSFKRVSFFNEQPLARKLSKNDHEILFKVIELFDWLANPVPPLVEEETEAGEAESVLQTASFDPIAQKIVFDSLGSTFQGKDQSWPWQAVRVYLKSLKRTEDLKLLTENPIVPKGLQLFLRVWFVNLRGSKEDEAIKISLKVVNAFKKTGLLQYMEIVHFDPQDNQLHWTEY